MIGWIISTTFQFQFIAIVVDVIDRRGNSNEMSCQLQPKKIKIVQ